jgi:hypothetical protein
VNIAGGCCGTTPRHNGVEYVAKITNQRFTSGGDVVRIIRTVRIIIPMGRNLKKLLTMEIPPSSEDKG